MKKFLLILGVALCTFILGDIIFLVTNNGLLANWGSIIIPSIISGVIISKHFKEDKSNIVKADSWNRSYC